MESCIMTYSQLREILVGRYSTRPDHLSRDEHIRRLEQNIFGPFHSLVFTVDRLKDLPDYV